MKLGVDMDFRCWINSAAGIVGRAATFGEAELRRRAFPSWSLGTSETAQERAAGFLVVE